MTLNLLPGVPVAGTLSLTLVPVEPASSFDPAAPSVAIATGATAVVAQCLVPGGTYTGVTSEVNRIEKYRACSPEPYYVRGKKTVNWDRFTVITDFQDPDADISAVDVALGEDTEWWAIERLGKDGQTALEVGDWVNVRKFGVIGKNDLYSDDEGAEAAVEIQLAYLGVEKRRVQMVA